MTPRTGRSEGDEAVPIRPEMQSLYPDNWAEIVERVRARSGNRCEWCGAANHKPHPETGSVVVLTTAHLDHNPANCSMDNLRHLCQRCHNRYDAPVRRRGIVERREQRDGQSLLI